ncbi:thiamine biosynthesis protein ThiC [Desulfitobacterium hafniense DCB-2]|uniref:Phosphomethylpyrimidine synthase n=1 Tax=Desulfitobacterium hafniense (strain DSM 10664 / DCB-2) TaxID=272564 RepID=THIC_DESHD|nr:phosphomethylpyrimidine synthase ThiC [Desulfitobacterium hafniense]B8FUD2.1 RecName: Full=Phosphomethylpyrimidine synthase; AltName: Full=Hydroxymethylpyrimidine phosphate synthase; Short=HMP-P synthase; Short=HMP-phosphate synthase; Short=HMPP synthase; AltName: Full=Thiamine biosynthesis protein ThiC [Desulfitobacterium hafniense DCB-2]ACL20546.1 thiamine biosynthesis protein ThiC [Desulfitobacterium hafniense DCB-2]
MTQLQEARKGIITPEMVQAAELEGITGEELRQKIAIGEAVLPCNINHQGLRPMAVGKGLSTKVNANIGTSDAYPELAPELSKLEIAVAAGVHSIMDLSTGGDIDEIRRRIIQDSPVMVGTVPLYQVMVDTHKAGRGLVEMTDDEIFAGIEKHCRDGADFITVHCGVTLEVIQELREQGRVMDIVSRGGSFITAWMLHHQRQNPLFEQYDRLLNIALHYDVTLSLGDGLRPGCLADATDGPQIKELITLGSLVKRAQEAGVQVMVEGPGHVPLHQIETNMQLAKTLCHNAPFYVLGPLVTDVAPGYDHITSAIGGAIAASSGADFLCYVTPAEHLGLPTEEDVKEGVIAARIAAHAADLVKGIKGAWEWDLEMAKARKALDWPKQIQLSIDPEKAGRMRKAKNEDSQERCTMCGKFCAYQLISDYMGTPFKGC